MGNKAIGRLIIIGLVLLRCAIAALTIATWIIVPTIFLDIIFPNLLSEHLTLSLTVCALAGVIADAENSRFVRRWWKNRKTRTSDLVQTKKHDD
jgi:hypothetical protein